MIIKPDDQQSLGDRARKYVRGIVVAAMLTLTALLFLYATLYGETGNGALAQPEEAATASFQHETGSLPQQVQ